MVEISRSAHACELDMTTEGNEACRGSPESVQECADVFLEGNLPVQANVSLDWEAYRKHSSSPGFCSFQLQVNEASQGTERLSPCKYPATFEDSAESLALNRSPWSCRGGGRISGQDQHFRCIHADQVGCWALEVQVAVSGGKQLPRRRCGGDKDRHRCSSEIPV